jgi:antitoxin (DNA-binding transcriptional repressor) of toxin-antitoxin stability system
MTYGAINIRSICSPQLPAQSGTTLLRFEPGATGRFRSAHDRPAARPLSVPTLKPRRDTCYTTAMKSVTIRDLRHHWPETEKALEVEGEILVTRDSRPIAKLVRITIPKDARARFDPAEHARWQRKVNEGRPTRWVDKALAESRAERSPKRVR